MEENLPTSFLVLAGLLRLAGVSQSEPWSSHQVDQEESPMTTQTQPASARDAVEATLQLDHFTLTFADDVSHSQETNGTQAVGVTKDKNPLITILATERQTEKSEQSLGTAIIGYQSDAPFSSKPSTGKSALTGVQESKAESSSPSKNSENFLPRKDGTGNSTAGEFTGVERSTPVPSKMLVVEPLATQTLSSDSFRSAGQQVMWSISLSPAAATGNLHMFTLVGKSTEAEDPLGQMPAKESLEKLQTRVPESGQSSQVQSQPAKPDIESSDVFRTSDLLTQPQSPFLKIRVSTISGQSVLEENAAVIPKTKMAQPSSFASSPHGEMKDHKLIQTANLTFLAPSQSNTRPLPFLSTPGTLSLKTSSQSAFSGDIGQSSLSQLMLSSQFPSFSQPAASTQLEGHVPECMNETLHNTDHHTTTQTDLSKLSQTDALHSRLLPVSQMKETTVAAPVPVLSKSQPSGVLPPVHGRQQGRVPSMIPKANLKSSHDRPTMLAPSKVGSPSLVASAAATPSISQILSTFQLPAAPSSGYGEQPFPGTFSPEPVVVSSAPASTKQQMPVIHSGLKRLARPTPSYTEPAVVYSLAKTKAPSPGPSTPWRAGFSTATVIESAHSGLKPTTLSIFADGGRHRNIFSLHTPYKAEQQVLRDPASTHTRSTTPESFPPHAQSDVPGASIVPTWSFLTTSVLNQPRQKMSRDVPLPLHAKTPSLLAQVSGESSILHMNALSHVKSQVPGGAVSFIDDSHLPVTSASAHAKEKMDEATVDSRLPSSSDAITPPRRGVSFSTHTNVQSFIFSATTEHMLSDVSVKLGTQFHNETGAPKSSSSPPVHHPLADVASHRQLKLEPSSTSALIDTSLQLPETSIPAGIGTLAPSISKYVYPGLQLPATTPVLPEMFSHSSEKASEGKPSPPSSPLTSQTGTHQAALVGIPSLPLKRGSPRPGSPAPQVQEARLPFVSGTLVKGGPPQPKTTPVLAMPDVQDLMYSSLGFIQPHNRSDVLPVVRSLDSPAAGEYLGMPPPLHYLSVLVRNAENMVCLQPIQDATTPPFGESNASGRGAASAQEMLLLSSSLGFPHLSTSGLAQMSPSSFILVKPVLVFLPSDKPEVPILSSAVEGRERKASPLVTNKTVLGLVPLESIQEEPVESSPTLSTIRNSTQALSANVLLSVKQVISGPVLKASLKSVPETSLGRSSSATTVPFFHELKEPNTGTQSLNSKNQAEGFPSSPLVFQELEVNNPVLLPVGSSAEHQVSVTPPVPVASSLQQRSNSLPASSSLYSLVEPSTSQRLTSFLPLRATERPQQRLKMFPAHAETGPRGSITLLTSIGKNIGGSLRASSARNTEPPLETEQQFTRSRPTLWGSSRTNLMGKLHGSTQSVPSVVSDFLLLSNEEKHKVTKALNYSHSKAIIAFPMATEMSPYLAKATSSKPSKHHPKTPKANEGLTSPPSFTMSSTDSGIQMTGDQLEGIRDNQVLSRPSEDVPSHWPASSSFAMPAPKHNLTTLEVDGRVSPPKMEDHTEIVEERIERATQTHHQREGTRSTSPTMVGRDLGHLLPLLVVTELNSMTGSSYGTGDVQRGVHTLSPAPVPQFAPYSDHKELALSPMGGKMSITERADWYGPDSTINGPNKERDRPLRGGEHGGIVAHSPTPTSFPLQHISFEGNHQERPRLLDDNLAQKDASSSLKPSGTPSSVFSIILNASTFPLTTLYPSAGADGGGWISSQIPHLQTLPLDASETFLNLHTQIHPSMESLSDASEATTEHDFNGEFATRESDESLTYTVDTGRSDATDGAEDPVSALQPGNSDRKTHHRRELRSDDVFLDGFAVVSDDSCSSGNYSTEMSLQPVVASSSPDSFLALIMVQDNSSQPTLRIESCCVTPTSRPTEPEAACCLFPRLPQECEHIHFHQNGQSGTASFTIQLFQMLNHSVVYLHCELSVCLNKQGGCEQGCLGNRETLSRMSNRSSYQTRHNLISFGPVWKTQPEFPSESAAGPAMAVMLLFLLGSLTGAVLLMSIAVFIWLHRKCEIKTADNVESQGSYAP